jgi:hemin uptake protein HemP
MVPAAEKLAHRQAESRPAAPVPSVSALQRTRISTECLMGGRREIVLQHGREEYRLRITSNGKLILTK